MKDVAILGSTGSIGTQTLDVIRENPEAYRVVTLTCGTNIPVLKEQIAEFQPSLVVTQREEDCTELSLLLSGQGVRFAWGEEGLQEAARTGDVVVNALMGMRGLVPTLEAAKAGKAIALANKETLVAGGDLVMKTARDHGATILPVDSEHSAIFQCLMARAGSQIRRILLTASGGPFRQASPKELESVAVDQALAHPNWSMGRKITIDSATMMNKGLEVIEAAWLFGVPLDQIQVVVHPESIVHSAVEFEDTSVIAQMGLPDMRIPISLALGWPRRIPWHAKGLDLFQVGTLQFERPDLDRFPCLALALSAARTGGTMPAVMNAANEVLVERFLAREIEFLDIPAGVERVMSLHTAVPEPALEDILEADQWARQQAREGIQ